MTPFWNEQKQVWAVDIPARLSASRKRQRKFFKTRDQARNFCGGFKQEVQEHGKQSLTSDDRLVIGVLRKELGGDLSIVPEILRHWKRTGEVLQRTSINDAVGEFLDIADRDFANRRTLNDIKERLAKFRDEFSGRSVHEVSATDIERYLTNYSPGWDRWSHHKRLGPFFDLAKRRRWIAADPMEDVPKPKTPAPERDIYNVQDFQELLWSAELSQPSILPYIVLGGFCFLRTSELVKMYADEEVLQWSDVLWDDKLIHVRPEVAKGTKRESDERLIPLNDAARSWLEPIRKASGPCVPHSTKKFGELLRRVAFGAGIELIKNGLRHSCLSYALSANPEFGVALVAQWSGNSERVVRRHYRRLLKPDAAKEWFEVQRYKEHVPPVINPRTGERLA